MMLRAAETSFTGHAAKSIVIFLLISLAQIVPALLVRAATQVQSVAPSEPTISPGYTFAEKTGEEIYANICRGCHMPDGGGAAGAGRYPSLIGDANLAASGYPVYVVVRGQKAMPAFGAMMSDEQVAAVVNYVRSHFGNAYQDEVRAEDVKVVRP